MQKVTQKYKIGDMLPPPQGKTKGVALYSQ